MTLETKGHLRNPCFDSQLGEEFAKQGVGGIVEDDETGINRQSGIGAFFDFDGVRVPAKIIILFEERHVMALLQQMSRDDAGNPTTDHGNLLALGRLIARFSHSNLRALETRERKHWFALCKQKIPDCSDTWLQAWEFRKLSTTKSR